jgi:hypothetical protein
MIRGRLACSMFCLATACSSDLVTAGDTTTVGDATTQTESESGSDGAIPDLPMPDLPVEPECPAGLGEVVACDCAVVEGCSIPNAEPETGCMFACDVPEPCPEVTCTFDGSTSWPTCEADLDVAALQCVFDALAEGQPITWTTHQSDTAWNQWDVTHREFLRLDATTYVRYGVHRYGNHLEGDGPSHYSFEGLEIPESAWMECDAAGDDYERFNCLHALGGEGEPCPDPSTLMCPPSP